MAYSRPSQIEMQKCMKSPKCIRNVSILAHVDHGKTTIADTLLATNKLVSKRLAGSLRYLDDRRDEQERQITMKSSAVSLLNVVHDENDGSNHLLLLNLIDTPGHIDFSSEVTAAVRVSDGALILVDVVEGVCVQTRESIKQAFEQKAKMILVLNKLDRYFTNLMKDVEDVFRGISQVIENCNAIIAEFYQYTDNEIDIEDTDLLFQPDKGNVIFASAIDGWGFTTKQIAKMFLNMIPNESVDSLNEKIWNFDCYVDAKSKTIKTGAIEHKKMNVFTQLCLKTLEYVYNTIVIRMEREKVDVILKKLNITNVTRDMTHNDTKIQVKAILESWKPLADTILQQCFRIIRPPSEIQLEKIQCFLNQHYFYDDKYVNECIENLIPFFSSCSSDDETPVVLYVSKMFCVNKKNLSQNKPKVFVPKPRSEREKEDILKKRDNSESIEQNGDSEDDVITVALARVFTGNLKQGDVLYILHPGYTPDKDKIDQNMEDFIENNKLITKVTIKELYMLLGKELVLVENVPAGNVCGIRGLESAIIRTATLSSTVRCVPFVEQLQQDPVVRNVIEPVNPTDLPVLRQGLKHLMQSDSCVQVVTQETGELVLLTSGDVHLEKCLEDLTTKFAKIEINVSSPMVSLRETIIHTSKRYDYKEDDINTLTVDSGPFKVSVIAVSLPEYISRVVKQNFELLRSIEEYKAKSENEIKSDENRFKSEHINAAICKVKEQLKKHLVQRKTFGKTLKIKFGVWVK
ncbi:hypothetical protein HHI36_014229 [Cryptolaemus montrouzieri]|uniref:Tr-type G domain-containing protein n=1 Tax=Cryptolaemus montrouzieri TaxID=559131 RepID=A0ABD2N2G1_9CUCU